MPTRDEAPKITLQKDDEGNVLTNPITNWVLTPAAEIAILLAVQYVETQDQLERWDTHQIQFVLTPQQGLELAEKLTKLAQWLMGDRSGRLPQ